MPMFYQKNFRFLSLRFSNLNVSMWWACFSRRHGFRPSDISAVIPGYFEEAESVNKTGGDKDRNVSVYDWRQRLPRLRPPLSSSSSNDTILCDSRCPDIRW